MMAIDSNYQFKVVIDTHPQPEPSITLEQVEVGRWYQMSDTCPPYCKDPTWFDVRTKKGWDGELCRWGTHWYCSMVNDWDIESWMYPGVKR